MTTLNGGPFGSVKKGSPASSRPGGVTKVKRLEEAVGVSGWFRDGGVPREHLRPEEP